MSLNQSTKNYFICFVMLFVFSFISCTSPKIKSQDYSLRTTNSIIDSANRLLNGGNIKQSIIYLDLAYRAFPKAGPIDCCIMYRYRVNFYLVYEYNLKKARLNADSMLNVIRGKKNSYKYKKEYAEALFANGDVLMAEKKKEIAFKQYYQGEQFIEKNLTICDIKNFTHKLGLIEFNRRHYHVALAYFKRVLQEDNYCRDKFGVKSNPEVIQQVMNGIALCFERSNIRDSAVVYYKKSIAYIVQNEARFTNKEYIEISKAVVYGNLGGLYSTMNNYTDAEKYLKESIRINDHKEKDIRDAQTAKIKLADLYIRYSHFKQAERLLNEVQAYLKTFGGTAINESIRINWYKQKWINADKTGHLKQSYAYLQKYKLVQDSIYEADKIEHNTDLETSFQKSDQQLKLIQEDKDNKLKTTYLTIVLIFLTTTIIMLFIVSKNRIKLRKLNKKILIQNANIFASLNALQDSHKENTRVMAVIAHDLRAPMAANISIISLLLESDDFLPKHREMMEMLKTSNFRYLDLVTDLLNIEPSDSLLKKEQVELKLLIENCISILQLKAEKKNQKIVLHAANTLININREKIWRVFSNLITNAIKFSPTGSQIDIEIQQKQSSILVIIRDNGIGIHKEHKDKIFKMFTSVKRKGTSGEESFGLGLAISLQIIKKHGGEIWFESEIGKGTSFFVELPIT